MKINFEKWLKGRQRPGVELNGKTVMLKGSAVSGSEWNPVWSNFLCKTSFAITPNQMRFEHHHQVRHVVAAPSSNVGAPPPFAQFWVAMSHPPLDPGPLHLPKSTDRPTARTCRSQTEIVDCGGRRCKSLSARDAFQTRPSLCVLPASSVLSLRTT